MEGPLTFEELASLMKSSAGVTVDPRELERRPEAKFEEFGLDSLGLLGIVGDLENRHGRSIIAGAEMCKTPGDFMDVVNSSLTEGE
jgi:minimal PKS acyl carrier protein